MTDASGARLPGLDLLRALAISWVMVFHAGTLGLGWAVEPVSRLGWMGVDLFFVLSGFLIGRQWFAALATGAPRPFATFYRRRAFRILPAYAVIVAVYFALPALRERPDIQPLWEFVTFTENLFIDFSRGKAFSHVWSLCVEEHFYVVFPLLAFALLRRPRVGLTSAVVAGIVLFGVALRAWLWFQVVAAPDAPGSFSQRYYEHLYYPTWTRLDGLVVGVALAVVEARRPQVWRVLVARPLWPALVGLGLFALAVALCVDGDTVSTAIVGYPAVAAAMGAFVVAGASPAMRLEVPGAQTLATLSYSLYLSHKLALHAAGGWAASQPPAVAVVAEVVGVLLAGLALHYAVERPFLRLRARGADRTSLRPR